MNREVVEQKKLINSESNSDGKYLHERCMQNKQKCDLYIAIKLNVAFCLKKLKMLFPPKSE